MKAQWISYEWRIRLGILTVAAIALLLALLPFAPWTLTALAISVLLFSAKCIWWWRRVPADIPIFLMLHSVSDTVVDETCANNTLRPTELERLIVDLKLAGYTFLTASEAAAHPVRRCIALTFDDGYVDNYKELFPILKRQQVKATCFITNQGLTDPAFLTPVQILDMAASGLVEFGGHTAHHAKLNTIPQEDIADEIKANIEWLQTLLGKPITSFAYPCGEYNSIAFETLKQLNIPFAYTMHKKMKPVAKAPLLIHRQIIPRGKTPWQNYFLATRGRYKI